MNTQEFVRFVTEFMNKDGSKDAVTINDVKKSVKLFTEGITAALSDGNSVSFLGFGSFQVQNVKGRTGHNPSTGTKITIPAYNRPTFKAGSKLKGAVNPS